MSSRKNSHNYRFWTTQAITASVNSSSINIKYLDNLGIQLIVTTTGNNGQFSIAVSNDNVNWKTLTLSPSIPVLASANTNIFVNLQQVGAEWLRVVFTEGATKTNGTVEGYAVMKEL